MIGSFIQISISQIQIVRVPADVQLRNCVTLLTIIVFHLFVCEIVLQIHCVFRE